MVPSKAITNLRLYKEHTLSCFIEYLECTENSPNTPAVSVADDRIDNKKPIIGILCHN